MRNPAWTRDEHIIAMDFYLRHQTAIPLKGSQEIHDLSESLSKLHQKIHGEHAESFRNQNGVYMKLMNFRSIDPNYSGVGLSHGSKDEKAVWDFYIDRPIELRRLAHQLTQLLAIEKSLSIVEFADDEIEAEEGALLSRMHKIRERDTSLVKKKK